MGFHFYWFVPTSGDGRRLGRPDPEREPSLEYVIRVARAAESAGFEGILVPTGIPYLESWMVGSAILHHTERIIPLVAFRPGLVSPSVAAKTAATLDQFGRGRLAVNVVTGGSPYELGQDGDFLEHDVRYARTDEFLEVVKKLWRDPVVHHEGRFYKIAAGVLKPKNYVGREIPVYFGGSSERGKEVAAKHADVYLQWGEPVEQVHAQIQDVQARAARYGRTLEFGVRMHVIVRDTEQAAWQAAEELVGEIDPDVEARMQAYFQEADSEAQRRMSQLVKGDLRFGKYQWAGIGRVRKGAGTAVVGTPEQVEEVLRDYATAGVTHFILSGYPHDEEALRFGETVLPRFQRETNQMITAKGEWA
ncbi:LLM class flavin-dependent oxidoreductase [Brevibacillus marinus]|uniref:LLM class flavin-dependent oxidoreductase n=1 Tax=Brevibacillus marinus TaxID=2496837 RepID=UPI000F83FD77|nr:LLM class flavin-dependent oxidoreductase [Brevibacillus marinus]